MDKKIENSLKIYDEISRQIQFADTKAGLILAWHGATLFLLFRTVLTPSNQIIMGSAEWTILGFALFFVFISLVNVISTIMPKIDSPVNNNCMFWIMDIIGDNPKETFPETIQRFSKNIEDQEKLFKCISTSIVVVSQILKLKYERVQIAIGGLVAGMVLEIIFLIMCLYGKN